MFSISNARKLANCRNYASRLVQQARNNYVSRRWETLQQEVLQENQQKLLAILPEAEILETLSNFPTEKESTAFCLYSPNGSPAHQTEYKAQHGGKLPAYCYAARVFWDSTEWFACLDLCGRLWLQATADALLCRLVEYGSALEQELEQEGYNAAEWNILMEWPVCHTHSLSGHWIGTYASKLPAVFAYVAALEHKENGKLFCAALDKQGNSFWTWNILGN